MSCHTFTATYNSVKFYPQHKMVSFQAWRDVQKKEPLIVLSLRFKNPILLIEKKKKRTSDILLLMTEALKNQWNAKEWQKMTEQILITACGPEMLCKRGRCCSKWGALTKKEGGNKWDKGNVRQHDHISLISVINEAANYIFLACRNIWPVSFFFQHLFNPLSNFQHFEIRNKR